MTTPAGIAGSGRAPSGLRAAGFALLAIAAGAAGMLVLERVGGLQLPGCGMGSPCAQIAASKWGKVPGVQWPVSYVGLAYFLGLIAAWARSGAGVAPALRMIVRVGAAASVGFTAIMIQQGHLCSYCLAVHIANLAFWILVERSPRATAAGAARAKFPAVTALASIFAVATVLLAIVEGATKRAAVQDAEEKLAASTARVIEESARPGVGADASGSGNQSGGEGASGPAGDANLGDASEAGAATTPSIEKSATSAAAPATAPTTPAAGTQPRPRGFTGRYRLGPESAPMRIVIISDYQCEDCARLEKEVRAIAGQRKDISITAKHFPFCSDCNDFARQNNFNPHPNACNAARAAEAAGIIRGNAGFWRMHEWLFDRGGGFTKTEIEAYVQQEGYDLAEWNAAFLGREANDRVRADVEEAMGLGLRYTPMVFVNAVELEGVRIPGALTRALANIAAQHPVARTAAEDRAPTATEKIINDWRKEPVRPIPADSRDWAWGPTGVPVTVTLWGDYQEPKTAEIDAFLRTVIGARADASYHFRHYPINKACNPVATLDKHPLACRASQAAEAAGSLGGADAYRTMHEWLMKNQKTFSDDGLRRAARSAALDADAFIAAMNAPEAAAAIAEDARAGKQIGLTGVPTIVVNGKQVRLWRDDGEVVVNTILDEASRGR